MTANFVKTMKETIETERTDTVIDVALNLLDILYDNTIEKNRFRY